MAVPEQVRKQTEAVNALYKELGSDAPVTSPVEGEVVVAPVEGIVPDVAPADVDVTVAPAAAPNESAADYDGSYEQKFRSLQGIYEVDFPRMNAENQALVQKVGQLEQLISTMQSFPAPVPEQHQPVASSLTTEEVEEYGESIDIMRKVSQEVAGPYERRIADLQTQIHNLQGAVIPRVEQIASQQVASAEQTFWNELSQAVPKWRDININQNFQTWLMEVDPLTGQTRQFFLEDAQRVMDVFRVASFFSSWLSTQSASPDVPNPVTPASELERQVAPSRSRNTGTPEGDTARTYTPKDIATFFDDVRSGKYAGKEEERNRFERDIFAAQREGRIVNA